MPRYIVRCGAMRSLGVFTTSRGDTLARGSNVIARTDRGLEVGEVLCEANDQTTSQLKNPGRGQVLRELSGDDQKELARMTAMSRKEFEICRGYIKELKLQMDLVDVEHIFGGERIVFYYLAENRVDFRELVKKLASEFQTRIEMRQIGVRDEAKLLADYGDCGKPVCCNTHLTEMPPVSMKMAKIQRATLDPTKISGRCGRLKCCLRYEYDSYVDMQRELPNIGSTVLTRDGQMRVIGQEVLTQQLLVETEDHRRILIAASDVLSIVSQPCRGKRKSDPPKEQPAKGEEPPGRGPRRKEKRRRGRDRSADDANPPDGAQSSESTSESAPPEAPPDDKTKGSSNSSAPEERADGGTPDSA